MATASYDWNAIVEGLTRYLRLRSIPIGMKLFETIEEMEAIPKIRRPRAKHTTDQIVAQARQLGWTVGITMADLVGAQCGAVIGLHPQDDEWLSGKRMAGVWFKTQEDARLHQHAMDVVPHGRYRAMAVSPLKIPLVMSASFPCRVTWSRIVSRLIHLIEWRNPITNAPPSTTTLAAPLPVRTKARSALVRL